MALELVCLYIITISAIIYSISKLYEFVKGNDVKMRIDVIPIIQPCEFEKEKQKKKKGKK